MTEEAIGRVPAWHEIQERLQLKQPHPILISESPRIQVLIEPGLGAIAVAAPVQAAVSGTRFPARGLRLQPQDPGVCAVWIDEPSLAEIGWGFLSGLAPKLVAGVSLDVALESDLGRWRALLQALSSTEVSAAVGVLGELAVVRAALELGHDRSCWVGKARGSIDFRFGQVECEVKTTTGNRHEHLIHGSDQLWPSVGSMLVLLSLRVGVTEDGTGSSVRDLVGNIVALGVSEEDLEQVLQARGVHIDDPACQTAYVLRAEPLPVNAEDAPTLTAAVLQAMYGESATRIRDVSYRLDLEGLPEERPQLVSDLTARIRL